MNLQKLEQKRNEYYDKYEATNDESYLKEWYKFNSMILEAIKKSYCNIDRNKYNKNYLYNKQ